MSEEKFLRGGSWSGNSGNLRAACYDSYGVYWGGNDGFRLIQDPNCDSLREGLCSYSAVLLRGAFRIRTSNDYCNRNVGFRVVYNE